MAEEIRYNVVSRADSKGFNEASKDVKKLKGEVDHLGGAFDKAGTDAFNFGDALEEAREKVKQLNAEFERTGDVTLLKQANQQWSFVAQLERIRKAGAGDGIDLNMPRLDFSKLVSESRGMLITGAVVLGAGAAPVIGAAIAGAVTGAVGAGGIIGGVVAAAGDPRVKDAWTQFVDSLSADDFGRQAFVKPTIAAIGELKSALSDMDIGGSLERVAPFTEMFARGIGDLGREFMPGFNAALDRAGPFLAVFSDELGDTGDALGDMLDDMSSSRGAVEGLEALFDALQGTMRWLGSTTNNLADAWDALTNVGEPVSDAFADVLETGDRVISRLNGISLASPAVSWAWGTMADRARNVQQNTERWNNAAADSARVATTVGQEWRRVAGATDTVTAKLILQRDALVKLNDGWREYFGVAMGVDEANQRANEAVLKLRVGLAENGRDWRTNTEAGLANRSLVLSTIEAFERQRVAAVTAAGDSVEAVRRANRHYEDNVAMLKAIATQAGLTGAALKDLIGDYQMRLVLQPVVEAGSAQLAKMIMAGLSNFNFANIADSKATVPSRGRPLPGFATGGETPAFAPFRVGERGPEVMFSSRSHYVATKAQMGSGGSGATMSPRPVIVNGAGLGEIVMRWLRNEIANQGGTLAVLGIRS